VGETIPSCLPFESFGFAEAFRGHRAAGRLYGILKAHNWPISTTTLSKLAGYKDRCSVSQRLAWLEKVGLVAKTAKLWAITAKNIHDVATERGTQNMSARQRAEHELDRTLFKIASAIKVGQAAENLDGTIVSLETGETLINPHLLSGRAYLNRWLRMVTRLKEKGYHVKVLAENETKVAGEAK
jgi:hypothetical protein